MIEMMAVVYVTSLVASFLVALWNMSMTRQRLNSKSLQTLNANLQKVDLYWLSANDDFATLTPDAVEKDKKKSLRNSFLVGLLGFAGAIGFVLLVLVVISLNYIAKSRKQVAVFRSELATRADLSKNEVALLVESFSHY